MALLDLLGRRWTLRVLWELREEPRTFGQIQSGEISTSVLSQRLRELAEANVVERTGEGAYALTPAGRQLAVLLVPLNGWANEHFG